MATSYESHFIKLGGEELHVRTLGDPSLPHLLCVHGLTRSGRDFDHVALAFQHDFFVMMPDLPGRGLSTWSDNPEETYRLPRYAEQMAQLMDHFGSRHVFWLGTSLGGLIAMHGAGGVLMGRLAAIILNDVGPVIPTETAQLIADYTTHPQIFDRPSDMLDHVRDMYQLFGVQSEQEWKIFLRRSLRRTDDGRFTFQHDPRVLLGAQKYVGDFDLLDKFAGISVPILLIHGALSGLVTDSHVAEMRAMQPSMNYARIEGRGHAPYLDTQEQQNIIREFLTMQMGK